MEPRASAVLTPTVEGGGADLAPKLREGHPDLYCCEQGVCAPVPADATFYLNAEQLPSHVYREAVGREAHCDCIVAAPCPEDGVVLVAYELKALGNLPSIVAGLLSPRRSGHGAEKEARRLIEKHYLADKLAGCLMVAGRLEERLELEPRAAVAALVAGFSSIDEFVETVLKHINNHGTSSDPYIIKRAVYKAANALFKTITKVLEEELASRLRRARTRRLYVMLGHNRGIWRRLCEYL